jgi:uncharacterized protein YcgL (UPF0745 family)
VDVLELRPVDRREMEEVLAALREFGAMPVDIVLIFADRDSARELAGADVETVKAIEREGHYVLVLVRPDKLSLWRELAAISALNDVDAVSIWARPEHVGGELAELLSIALYRRVVDLYIARRDVQLLASSFNPQDMPVEADDVKRSLVYTLALDATVSIAVAGFRSLAEELYLRVKRVPIYNLYSRFRNFVINNFKFEYIYNYLSLI